jgi:hypothetical protein
MTTAEWKRAMILPLYKKGDKKDPNNYREMDLLNSCYKISTKIQNEKLKRYLETFSHETQSGFRKG